MELSKTPLIESVFAGRGEVATQMRSLDWSTTALGPVEQWPQALRTARSNRAGLRLSDDHLLGAGLTLSCTTMPYGRCWGQSIPGRSVVSAAKCIPRHGILSGSFTKRC